MDPSRIGEQEQQTCSREVGDQGGEAIVVAEIDLVGGDRVVLVDDRDDSQREGKRWSFYRDLGTTRLVVVDVSPSASMTVYSNTSCSAQPARSSSAR